MKKLFFLNILIVVVIQLSSCAYKDEGMIGNNDWTYSLPNNYLIEHINSREIVCSKEETKYSSRRVVSAYITEFCYNEVFVCLKKVDVNEDLSVEIDRSNPVFYIINTETDSVLGPFSKEEYGLYIGQLGISNLSSWIATYPRPENARFI